MPPALLQSELPFPVRRGKVRDVYDLGSSLLIVATDRISAFDCVMPNGIPDKGKVLTALSLFWFERFAREFPNHLIAADVAKYPTQLQPFAGQIAGRSMLVRKAEVVPIECVARGYLSGGGWAAYTETGSISGVALPPGLREGERLPAPIFTPTTKTPPELGHDMPLTFDEVAAQVGGSLAEQLKSITVGLYSRAAKIAEARDVILADTKFEFGLTPSGELLLADEALTTDSSRYWRVEDWKPGQRQVDYSKQYVRDWASDLGSWDKTPPGPEVPPDVIAETRRRSIAMYERITGTTWV
jgi:phosphoribosylaminoimidazole-succinocarboxamide synthase